MGLIARPALCTAAVRGPIDKISEAVAIFPGETQEFCGGEVISFVAEESFKAPAEIRAIPGLKAVAASDDPVIAKRAKHFRSTALV